MNNNIQISIAKKEHIEQLKNIWKICFGDSDDYVDFFFKNRFETCYGVIASVDDKVAGAMYLLPVKAREYDCEKNGFYIYAIGVLPEYRGKSIYVTMHSVLYDYLKANNLFCILCPANKKLAEYYKSLGFVENAYVYEDKYTGKEEIFNFTARELKAEEFELIRNKSFKDINPILWDKVALEYVLKENIYCNGKNLIIEFDNNKYFLLLRGAGDVITVYESNVTDKEIKQKISNYLSKIYNTKNIHWICAKGNSEPILYGLSCNLKKNNYYLNLILN